MYQETHRWRVKQPELPVGARVVDVATPERTGAVLFNNEDGVAVEWAEGGVSVYTHDRTHQLRTAR